MMYGLSEDIIKNVKAQSLIDAVLWWQECREVHQWMKTIDHFYDAEMSIVEIKSAAKRAVLDWSI